MKGKLLQLLLKTIFVSDSKDVINTRGTWLSFGANLEFFSNLFL